MDVYAFGGVMVELFGGRPLWGDLQPYQILFKVGVQEEVPDFSHLPPELQDICRMCFLKECPTAIQVLKHLLDLS